MTKRNAARSVAGTVLAIPCLALALGSCNMGYKSSGLVINQITDPNGSTQTLYVVLSRTPDFVSGFKTAAATYTLGTPTTPDAPAVSIDAIGWSGNDDQDAEAFWLLIADDDEIGANPGVIGDGDNILPAMRVFLEDGKTTTIDSIVFDTAAGPPVKFINAVSFVNPVQTFNVFVENRKLVSPTSPMYLRLGNLADLSGVNTTHDLPVVDPGLSSGLSLRIASSNGFVWLDINGSATLDSGDWISTVTATAAPALPGISDLVLWSGMTVP